MTQDSYMADVFPQPPLTAFKRQKNLRGILVKAKVPDIPKQYSQRQKKGMSKCGNQCTACPYIKTENRVKIKENSYWNRGYVNTKDESQPTGWHFNLPGHSLANMKATVLEQVKYHDEQYRKEREHFYIRKFYTFYRGITKQK